MQDEQNKIIITKGKLLPYWSSAAQLRRIIQMGRWVDAFYFILFFFFFVSLLHALPASPIFPSSCKTRRTTTNVQRPPLSKKQFSLVGLTFFLPSPSIVPSKTKTKKNRNKKSKERTELHGPENQLSPKCV